MCVLISIYIAAVHAGALQAGHARCYQSENGPLDQPHIKRRTNNYEQKIKQNNYIKRNQSLKQKGTTSNISMITVNINSLSDAARKWLSEQTADILLIQVQHMFLKKGFGKIPG